MGIRSRRTRTPHRSLAFSLLLIALGATTIPASAQQEEPNPARTGFYLGPGLALGIPLSLEKAFQDMTLQSVDVQPGFGIRGIAGYRAHARVAAEVEVEYLFTDFKAKVANTGNFDTTPLLLTGNAKGFILTGTIQPYIIAGAGVMDADVQNVGSSTEFAARFGGGLDVYATDHIVLGFDLTYVLPTGKLKDLDYLSIGLFTLQYRF